MKETSKIFSEKNPTYKKLLINYSRNKKLDHSQQLEEAAQIFDYQQCQNEYWNPEEFSLLYGTPLWEQASASQRVILNQLYWVAYYSQIISAEIATIFFNQTSATGLYTHEDFRLICDTLDLETSQERSHISAFKTISRQVEQALFGKSIFSYPMRGPFTETMVYADTNPFKIWWKKLQLQYFGIISSNNVFLACQYFTVRGIRTLNGKLVQHKLSNFYQKHPDKDNAPIPAKISYYHFLDESYHFNSSTIVSQEIPSFIDQPTKFEKLVANLGVRGCQRDHYHFSVAINGIFWYDPALYYKIEEVLRSPVFGMSEGEAKEMMRLCFTCESEGLHRSYQTHQEALESYKVYVEKLDYLWATNKEMSLMSSNTIPQYLATQQKAFKTFQQKKAYV